MGPDRPAQPWPHTRLEQIQSEGKDVPVVMLAAGSYLLEALLDAGPTLPDPHVGELPLRWVDVWAYMQATGEITEPWEARLIIDMSAAYLAGRRAGRDPLARSPMEVDRRRQRG